MPAQAKKKQKAITVAAVVAFLLALITSFALSDDADENIPFIGAFLISFILFFVLAYMITLMIVGLFKDNKPTDDHTE